MIRVLFYLWPALLPLAFYALWLAVRRRRARARGDAQLPGWRDGPLFLVVCASLAVGIVGLLWLGLSAPPALDRLP